MEKLIKQKILACEKLVQHKCSDIQLQYPSKIFTEPKNPVPILVSCLLNILHQYLLLYKIIQVLPIKTAYEFLFFHVCATINIPRQLT